MRKTHSKSSERRSATCLEWSRLIFYLAYHSKYIKDDHRARDLPHGAWVSVNFRGHGSGKRPASSAGKAAGPGEGRAKTRAQRLLLLGSEARTALDEANIPETLYLRPVLQSFKDMMGMQPDGSFDDDVAPQFLKNIISTADITVLNRIFAELDAVTNKEVCYFHKAMTYALVADYKAIELAYDEFQKLKTVQTTVMSYLYANLAMSSDNGQHDNNAVKNMIIERKKGMEKQAEVQRQQQEQQQQHARFVTMARDQLLAEAREQLLAEAREQILAEAKAANPNMMQD